MSDYKRTSLIARPRASRALDALAQHSAMLMSRFYPSVASLMAVFADVHFFGARQSVELGFVIGAIILPQVVDLGHTRRLTIEAGLASDSADRETQIQTSFRAFLLLALLIGCAIAVFAVGTVPKLRVDSWILVLCCALAGLSTALGQLVIAILYWRGSRHPIASVVVDPVLVLLFGTCLIWQPSYTPVLLAGSLVLRSLIVLAIAGYGRQTLRLMIQTRQSLATIITEARDYGHLELRLSLFCFVAWAIDPLLYGYFPTNAGTAQHLLATRFSQLAVNLTNVFLIGSLWRSSARANPASARGVPVRTTILLMLLMITTGVAWNALRPGSSIQSIVIYVAVFAGTTAAIARQKATLALLTAGGDMRDGASILLIIVIGTIKGAAVLLHNVVLFEFASVIASLFYLRRMARHV